MKSILLVKELLGLVEMTSGLVNASFSLPKWQAVKITFFAPVTVQTLKPGHLEEDCPITTFFWKQKILRSFSFFFSFFFRKWNTKIQGPTMQPLKTSKPDLSGNSPQIYKCYSLVHLFSENLAIGQSSSKRCSLSVPTVTVLQFFWNIFLTVHLP